MKTRLTPAPLAGAVVLEIERVNDERGFFMEPWNKRDFAAAGFEHEFVQEGHSRSHRGVLRGLHYQDMTAPMGKLVRCTVGAVFDVAVDLRVASPTFGQWYGLDLNAENGRQFYVPVGFAHGFLALTEGAEVQYKMTNFYTPSAEGAIAWDDPRIGIVWPAGVEPVLSAKDRRAPALDDYLKNPAFR